MVDYGNQRRRMAQKSGLEEEQIHLGRTNARKKIRENVSRKFTGRSRINPETEITRAVSGSSRLSVRSIARKMVTGFLREGFITQPTAKFFLGGSDKKFPALKQADETLLSKDKFRQILWQIRAQFQTLSGLMKSICIFGLEYEPATEDEPNSKTYVMFPTQERIYYRVPPEVIENWKIGAATCITFDPSGLKRWWLGKTPSLGAFYNSEIKGKYPSRRIS